MVSLPSRKIGVFYGYLTSSSSPGWLGGDFLSPD